MILLLQSYILACLQSLLCQSVCKQAHSRKYLRMFSNFFSFFTMRSFLLDLDSFWNTGTYRYVPVRSYCTIVLIIRSYKRRAIFGRVQTACIFGRVQTARHDGTTRTGTESYYRYFSTWYTLRIKSEFSGIFSIKI